MGFRDFDIPGVRKCGIGFMSNPNRSISDSRNAGIPKSHGPSHFNLGRLEYGYPIAAVRVTLVTEPRVRTRIPFPPPAPTPPPPTPYPLTLTIPLPCRDVHANRHTHNPMIFRLFQSPTLVMLIRAGMVETMERDQIGAILHSTGCRFRRPVFFPDAVEVGGRATEVGHDRFTMEYLVVSREQDAVVGEGTGIRSEEHTSELQSH